jgi:hypothetical protein
MFTATARHESPNLYVTAQAMGTNLKNVVSIAINSFVSELEFLPDDEAKLASSDFTITVKQGAPAPRPIAP